MKWNVEWNQIKGEMKINIKDVTSVCECVHVEFDLFDVRFGERDIFHPCEMPEILNRHYYIWSTVLIFQQRPAKKNMT